MKTTIRVLLSFLIMNLYISAEGRSFRVNQIPNGSAFSCTTCHNSSNGGSRNSFGQTIENGYLSQSGSSGNVVWNSSLAIIDSDGDESTNGEELIDPNGSWSIGNPNPGSSGEVTNPGDASSSPGTSSIFNRESGQVSILHQNFPNPVSSHTTISFTLDENADAKLEIIDLLGRTVVLLTEASYLPGTHELTWNRTDQMGKRVEPGLYFYYLKTDYFNELRKMIVK